MGTRVLRLKNLTRQKWKNPGFRPGSGTRVNSLADVVIAAAGSTFTTIEAKGEKVSSTLHSGSFSYDINNPIHPHNNYFYSSKSLHYFNKNSSV